MPSTMTTTYCSVEYANAFLSEHHWIDNWLASDTSGKLAVLVNSTNVIQRFVTFRDENENVIEYNPTSETDENIPDWLRQACCYEALYFLDLENDPARPFPLGILGLIRSDKEYFDHEYEPPLFSAMARQVLEENGAEVLDPNELGNVGWAAKKVL